MASLHVGAQGSDYVGWGGNFLTMQNMDEPGASAAEVRDGLTMHMLIHLGKHLNFACIRLEAWDVNLDSERLPIRPMSRRWLPMGL